jgi:hypothetical protein
MNLGLAVGCNKPTAHAPEGCRSGEKPRMAADGLRTRPQRRELMSIAEAQNPTRGDRVARQRASPPVRFAGSSPNCFGNEGDPDDSTASSSDGTPRRERTKGKMDAAGFFGILRGSKRENLEGPAGDGGRSRREARRQRASTECNLENPRTRAIDSLSARHEAQGNVRCGPLRRVSASYVL